MVALNEERQTDTLIAASNHALFMVPATNQQLPVQPRNVNGLRHWYPVVAFRIAGLPINTTFSCASSGVQNSLRIASGRSPLEETGLAYRTEQTPLHYPRNAAGLTCQYRLGWQACFTPTHAPSSSTACNQEFSSSGSAGSGFPSRSATFFEWL